MSIAMDPGAVNGEAVAAYVRSHDASLLEDDAVVVDVTSGLRWEGRAAIADMLDYLYRVAFDAHLEDVRLVVGREAVVVEATFVGRHLAEFAGIQPSGAMVRVPLVALYDVRDGRISAARIHFSVASFMAQAGENAAA